ncbi:transposase family protein [Saccharomonospora xinjiangensis XJ-54]|uniref:Transposase family protein n=1 Tax=Saccharomonospora xinjiangensis XJ-54 TaxID=882086 RepID=I0V857_9PSEU|nr:transposase family protein [Saccharomonospora xinjiangensis XJ-54]
MTGANSGRTARVDQRAGLPLAMAISAANVHNMNALRRLVRAIPAGRSPRGPHRRTPTRLHADKGYDYDLLRNWLRTRHITPRIARTSIESSQKLGRHRWVVERAISWLLNYRRLAQRWERKPMPADESGSNTASRT